MEKIRFGIVGMGVQGFGYVKNIFDKGIIENATLTAVCDGFQKSLDRVKENVKNLELAYFTDYNEMFDSGLIDAVIIVVPHFIHDEITVAAFKRKLHVLCEKPASVYTKQAKNMNEAADQAGTKFSMMFSLRTVPVYQRAKEIVASGELGQLQRVNWITTRWYRTQFYYNSGTWRATWKGEGGGLLLNQAPHQLDLLQWIVGEVPTSVRGFCGYGKWHDIEVEDEVTAYLEYANGATGVFISSTGELPGSDRLEIVGTKGRIQIDQYEKLTKQINESDAIEYIKTAQTMFEVPKFTTEVEEFDGIGGQHPGIIQNFVNAIQGKEELLVEGRDGLNSMELINGIEMSGWLGGKKVDLPLDDDKYLEMLNEKIATSKPKN